MSALERNHPVTAVHPGSELAIKDANAGWQKIHRVQHWMQLSAMERSYNVACGIRIETKIEAHPLSSGYLLGKRCSACWSHLIVDGEAAARQTAVNELITMLGRLQAVPGTYAAKLTRDCWSCIADLELGCHCEEAAHTLALSAGHWLELAA
jgi:hypothetical protein